MEQLTDRFIFGWMRQAGLAAVAVVPVAVASRGGGGGGGGGRGRGQVEGGEHHPEGAITNQDCRGSVGPGMEEGQDNSPLRQRWSIGIGEYRL